SDPEIDAIAKTGGVIHVTLFNGYLVRLTEAMSTRAKAVRKAYGLPESFPGAELGWGESAIQPDRQSGFDDEIAAIYPKATIADLVDHIDYIVKRVGVDHVGVGTDFNHGSGIPDFDDESQAINLTRELVRRGYSETDIAKIWGGNFLRVF